MLQHRARHDDAMDFRRAVIDAGDALTGVVALINLPSRLQDEQARSIDLHGAVREHLLHELLFADWAAELTARGGVFRHQGKNARRPADRARANVGEANAAERLEGVLEPIAFLAEQVLRTKGD